MSLLLIALCPQQLPVSEPEHEFTVASQSHPEPAAVSAPSSQGADSLQLNVSVAEMKERLKASKRQDLRQVKIPFEQKSKDFQRMWAAHSSIESCAFRSVMFFGATKPKCL